MDWDPKADARAKKLLEQHATELLAEAERIARRFSAGAVSVEYVNQAALTLKMRRPSAWADTLLSLGLAMMGLAGGVWTIDATASTPLHLKSWVAPTFIAVACAGFLLAGMGGALKIRPR